MSKKDITIELKDGTKKHGKAFETTTLEKSGKFEGEFKCQQNLRYLQHRLGVWDRLPKRRQEKEVNNQCEPQQKHLHR